MAKTKITKMKKTIPLTEAAGTRPIVTLDDKTIATFTTGRSVWEAFYAWLIANHNGGDNYTLHNRARVGEDLMKRLLKAESDRIRKKHKLTGVGLREALGWSNINAGPMTTFEGTGQRIVGDGLYIIDDKEWESKGERS